MLSCQLSSDVHAFIEGARWEAIRTDALEYVDKMERAAIEKQKHPELVEVLG